jgi:hypothetical protein
MKPDPLTDCLLRLSYAAEVVAYALHLAVKRRGILLPSERVAEATQWQTNRLFWARCYRSHMTAMLNPGC